MQTSFVVRCQSLALLLLATPFVFADEPNKNKDDALAAQRFELMQERVGSAIARSDEAGFPEKFASKPIFRYSDPARGYVAAAAWKLGDAGRPRAIVTTELHRLSFGSPRVIYEYLSLTPTRFSVTSNDMRWSPEGTALEFKPIPGAEAPLETPQRRLLQMRAISKRFAGSEVAGDGKTELRLLPQPVDRYTPSSAERADGGIFFLTFGTNPEIALLIESDGKGWNYAAGRLTAAGGVTLTIDDQPAWQGPPLKYGPTQPYTASSTAADIPGIASDGSEITK